MKLPAVQEVENLHHDKSVEDESEVPGVDMELFEYRLVIFFPVNQIKAP